VRAVPEKGAERRLTGPNLVQSRSKPGARPLNDRPDGGQGAQLFFYEADEPATYSRHRTGLHHLAFLVESRAVVREAHDHTPEKS